MLGKAMKNESKEHRASDPMTPGILCISHLGWDHVWQRPQQILSRLSQHYPVLYVAEPEIAPTADGEPRLDLVANEEHLRAWQPVVPDRPDILWSWRETYTALVQDLLRQEGWLNQDSGSPVATRPLILWFYTPIPWYMLDHLPAQLVIYDVMDDLASFKGAASDLPERETQLLARSDLVFAGGRSLYNSRKEKHPSIHLFPSGVDVDHFASALEPGTDVPPEVTSLPRPILGYYGVIDERIDLDLLEEIARQRPDWSIVMVGPIAKLEPSQLPIAPNLLYTGQQPYSRLPSFLKGFDVCVMPFGINGATQSISPTKTLEYMAARKPIVSTPVPDVVTNWSEEVQIALDPDGFVQAIERALAETGTERARRIVRQGRAVEHNGWERIVREMRTHIKVALPARALASLGLQPDSVASTGR
jgi:UDP-galactopyranose mutase